MRLEHYLVEKLKKEIRDIVGKHLDLREYKIFFFGSRVADKGNERSDIDIGVEGSKEILPAAMSRIKEEIENLPILYKIEIVDFKNITDDFKEVAMQNTEEI